MDWLNWFSGEQVSMTIRLIVAAILSGLIGLEREVNRHPAGFRTHLLVGVGSCLMMLLSLYGFLEFIQSYDTVRFDPSRLPSYVVSGIGFLGAGTILVHGVTVRGLTTAASIWVVAGIGLVVGIGMYYVAILTTVIVILSLIFLNKWESFFVKRARSETLYMLADSRHVTLSTIMELFEKYEVTVKHIDLEDSPQLGIGEIKYKFIVAFNKNNVLPQLYDEINRSEHVIKLYTSE